MRKAFFSWFSKIFLAPIFKAIFLKEVKGKENIPKPPFLLVSNHQSYLDILADGYIVLPKRFHFIGQIDGFKGILKWIILLVYFFTGTIPVDRKNENSRKKALEKGIEVLKKGDILIIYPEGKRSLDGKMLPGKLGCAKIVLETKAPVLPVGIQGTFKLLPPKGRLKLKKEIKINIGKPIYFKEEIKAAEKLNKDSLDYQELIKKIRDKIMEELLLLSQGN